MIENEELTGRVIGCAMRVHREFGFGFLEIVYRNALCVELRTEGIEHATEEPISVFYRQTKVGSFGVNALIEKTLIRELKAYEVQLVNYLNATGNDFGLLLNFYASSLESKRKYRKALAKTKI